MRCWPVYLAALLVLHTSCSKTAQTAEEIFAKAETTADDERYEDALALIPTEALLEEMKVAPGLRDRFLVLRGEMLAQRKDGAEGLALLAAPLRNGADRELDRHRRRSWGLAMCRTARTAADRESGVAVLDAVLAESPPLSAEAGKVQLRRGACLRAMAQFSRAEEAYLSALQAAKASRDRLLEAQVLSSLGSLCASLERFDEASVYTKDALRAAANAGAAGRHVTRRALDNLGWHQLELGDYERAMDTLRQFQPQHERERVVNETNQARTLLAMDDAEGAEQHFEKALAAARSGTNSDASQQVAVMQGLSMVSYRRGKWFDAARWNRQAMELAQKLKQTDMERAGNLIDARIRISQGDPAGAEPILRKLLADRDLPRGAQWTAHVELARVQAGRGKNAQAEAEFEKAMRLVEEAQSTLTAAEDRISYFSSGIEVYRQALQFLLKDNRAVDALAVAERSRARTMQDNSVRRARRGATVLFYWLDEPASHLWVVAPKSAPVYFRLPGAKEIQDLVERHNQFLLRARNPLTEGGQEARQLFEILVKPALRHLSGRRVFLSPDGGLHALNFETLVATGPPDHYWLEDAEISVVPGLTGSSNGTRPKSKRMLAAGDAVDTEAGYGRLRHAGEELDRIGAQFGVTPLRREAATPRAVKAALGEDPVYVHFAAHAAANRLRPLESAILLSPDGASHKLYAREVAKIPMRVQLVTLSACTAAGAKAFRGEGLVGFAWAFLGAGAENVVASLWEVDDASTPQLMEQMYRQLQLGRTPGEALREAKLAFLRSGTALQKPYFWGAFLHFQQ
ncbi:MAG: CHAT domain-containing protein [Acidobacteria bacterium]|nr:CHAT domain-containing protein [Acidobacteriota bacterium]